MSYPDVLSREDLPFPSSLPEFQRLFPNDAACAAYLEAIRWQHGFVCMWCGERGEPFRISTRPHVLRCRKCRKDNSLTESMLIRDVVCLSKKHAYPGRGLPLESARLWSAAGVLLRLRREP